MRDDGPSGAAPGSVVRLESHALRAALSKVRDLASSIDAGRRSVLAGTPVPLPSLQDGSVAARSAQWLGDQEEGMQSLLDLATLLEAKGASAMYVGAGTFAEAQARVPTEIVNLLAGLDPDDHQSRAALLSLRELLGRYAADPDIGQAIVEELGGTGMAEVFDVLTVEPPAADASANSVNQWWDGLSSTQQLAMMLLQGDKIGSRDGIPAESRDLANRAQIPEVRSALEARLAELTEGQFGGYNPYGAPNSEPAEAKEVREKLAALDSVESVLDLGGRQLLLLDADSGEQLHAAVAVGDVDTADHVAVFTPGFTTTVQDRLEGIDADMAALKARAERDSYRHGDGDTVATVSWLGYDAPQWDGIAFPSRSVASDDLAKAGGEDLAQFYAGINDSRSVDPHLTALGHSYGSTTTGYALQHEGTGVDDAIIFGSPGLGTSDRGDLDVPEDHLFRIEARRDPVADLAQFGIDPTWLDDVEGLSAKETEIDGESYGESVGHSEYLEDGTTSQHNMAVTVAGMPDRQVSDDGRGAGDVLTWWPEFMR